MVRDPSTALQRSPALYINTAVLQTPECSPSPILYLSHPTLPHQCVGRRARPRAPCPARAGGMIGVAHVVHAALYVLTLHRHFLMRLGVVRGRAGRGARRANSFVVGCFPVLTHYVL